MSQMRTLVSFLLIILCAGTACFAQSNRNETILITTYYPSPSGVYQSLRFQPSPQPPTGDKIESAGTMFVNIADNRLYVFNGATKKWVSAGVGAWLYNGSDLYFASTQNVGIGTSTPTRKLEVNGTIFASQDLCVSNGKCLSQMVIIPVNGVCGSSNGQVFTSAPTTNLCSKGDPSAVTGPANGPWSWTCSSINNGTVPTCVGNRPKGTCGSAAGVARAQAPTANLCASGSTASNMRTKEADFNFRWDCSAGTPPISVTCTARHEMLVCGGTCGYPPAPYTIRPGHCRADCYGTVVYGTGGDNVYCDLGSSVSAGCPAGWGTLSTSRSMTQYIPWVICY